MVELHKHHLQEQEEEQEQQEEEALSLCDLPLDEEEDELQHETAAISNRRSSSEPPDQFFEFFSNFSSELIMSSAEDIIFHGKLVPFKNLSPDPQIQTHCNSQYSSDHNRQHSSLRRRSESLSGLQFSSSVSRSNSINSTRSLMMRNSRSLDYRRLERFSSSKTSSSDQSENSIDRNSSPSRSSIGRGESIMSNKRTVARPRWYVLMFGKPPVEMELSDIKSRQVRRNISSKKPPVSNRSPSCRLLKVLSCRDNKSVAVTTPLWIPPPV